MVLEGGFLGFIEALAQTSEIFPIFTIRNSNVKQMASVWAASLKQK